jgi:hypothetical protein
MYIHVHVVVVKEQNKESGTPNAMYYIPMQVYERMYVCMYLSADLSLAFSRLSIRTKQPAECTDGISRPFAYCSVASSTTGRRRYFRKTSSSIRGIRCSRNCLSSHESYMQRSYELYLYANYVSTIIGMRLEQLHTYVNCKFTIPQKSFRQANTSICMRNDY